MAGSLEVPRDIRSLWGAVLPLPSRQNVQNVAVAGPASFHLDQRLAKSFEPGLPLFQKAKSNTHYIARAIVASFLNLRFDEAGQVIPKPECRLSDRNLYHFAPRLHNASGLHRYSAAIRRLKSLWR